MLTKYYVKNNHEAIIPRATRELTQELLKSKRYDNRQNNLFSLMIKCSNCGGCYQCKTQTREYFVKAFRFYQCENKLTKKGNTKTVVTLLKINLKSSSMTPHFNYIMCFLNWWMICALLPRK